ncbi:MAG: Gfo/Idh/MocA family oxidoreductase [Chloroflexi bacterium]|nr:Gfo/Idh/MocA family oxidoreductase [Chloroflexota bacterium]
MKPLRTAILGCGGFAKRHAQNLLTQPDLFELVAFCDVQSSSAQSFAQEYTQNRAAVFTDHCTLFREIALDLVLICLPPFAHSDEVEQAAAHGVHVFIEKPIALTSEHAWQMVRAAESHGIKTQVGFMFRFGAAIERLKCLIEQGAAGPVGLMSARYFCNHLHADWWRQRSHSGGQLVEQVIHMIDLMRYLMGDPVSVYSLQNNLFHRNIPEYTVEDVSGTVVGFEQGGIGVLYATNGAIPGKWINDYRLVAQNLTVDFTNANNAVITFTNGTALKTETITSDVNYHLLELLDLHRAIVEDGATRTPIREGALSLDLAVAATQSAESKAVVRLTPHENNPCALQHAGRQIIGRG